MELKMKWVYVALLLSIALNIFVFGVWIGRDAKELKSSPPVGRIEFNLREISRYLPPEERDTVRDFMRKKRPLLRETLTARRSTEQRIREILTTEIVNKEVLRAALDEHMTHSMRLQSPVRDVLLGTVADLDLETRQQIAKNIFRGRARRSPGDRPPAFDDRPPRRRPLPH